MVNNFKKYFHLYILIALLFSNFFVWSVIFTNENKFLTVAFLDIGQGDAIFIEAPNGNQILLDGGPNRSVLRGISKIMPFYDRSIDIVVASHPDKDHIGGLPEILKRYKVGAVIEPGVNNDTAIYKEFESTIKELKIKKILARRGMTIWLDEGVYMEILFPDTDVSDFNANDASIVARVVFGDSSFMLTGDSPKKIEKYIVSLDGGNLNSSVLKLGHHGSKTSTSDIFLSAVSPEYAIISAGRNNRYGHPHKEIIDLMKRFNIPYFETSKDGTVIFKTDGYDLYKK